MERLLFYFILILLPLNLGKHFVLHQSYVDGLLVDYLIPTIYLQDILLLLLIFIRFIKRASKLHFDVEKFFVKDETSNPLLKVDEVFVFFLFCLFVSSLMSFSPLFSFYYLARLLAYAWFAFYVANYPPNNILLRKIILWWIFVTCTFAIVQVFLQSSVFNNYLILGEQPYTSNTPSIHMETLFGYNFIPPYALFRHPNVLGGFLSIVLLLFINSVVRRLISIYRKAAHLDTSLFIIHPEEISAFGPYKINWDLFYSVVLKYIRNHPIESLVFCMGCISFVLSFSLAAYCSFGLGLLFFISKYLIPKHSFVFSVGTTLSLVLLCIYAFTGFSRTATSEESFYRRASLQYGSLELFKISPFFGIGLNNTTLLIEKYAPQTDDVRFVQPPHNIFILLLSETGIIGLLAFVLFVCSIIAKAWRMFIKNPVRGVQFYIISLLQFLILGSFDHYVLTIHQSLLLFLLTLGFCMAYTLRNEV